MTALAGDDDNNAALALRRRNLFRRECCACRNGKDGSENGFLARTLMCSCPKTGKSRVRIGSARTDATPNVHRI